MPHRDFTYWDSRDSAGASRDEWLLLGLLEAMGFTSRLDEGNFESMMIMMAEQL